MSISRYIVVTVVRCSCASSKLARRPVKLTKQGGSELREAHAALGEHQPFLVVDLATLGIEPVGMGRKVIGLRSAHNRARAGYAGSALRRDRWGHGRLRRVTPARARRARWRSGPRHHRATHSRLWGLPRHPRSTRSPGGRRPAAGGAGDADAHRRASHQSLPEPHGLDPVTARCRPGHFNAESGRVGASARDIAAYLYSIGPRPSVTPPSWPPVSRDTDMRR